MVRSFLFFDLYLPPSTTVIVNCSTTLQRDQDSNNDGPARFPETCCHISTTSESYIKVHCKASAVQAGIPLYFSNIQRFQRTSKGGKGAKGRQKKQDKKDEPEFKNLGEYFKSKEFAKTIYLTVGSIFLLNLISSSNPNENPETDALTFQEFKTKYLEKGLVKKLYVVNKFLVEAELLPQAVPENKAQTGLFGSFSSPAVVAFTIGSVDTFEEQMDELQDKLKISPDDRIPITYVDRASVFQYLLPFLPTIILLGGLYFITRKVNGGASGGAGGGGPFGGCLV